jgi:hypothetical protein
VSVPAHPHFLFFHYRWPRGSHHRDRKYGYYYFYVCIVNGKLDTKLDTSSYVKSSNGSLSGLVKNNEVWLIIFNRISTSDTCVCVASRYDDVVSVYTVSKSATMSINYNNQGTITVEHNGSTGGVYGGAFKF